MPILLILQALGKAALDAAKTRAGNVVVAAALAYGWGHHAAAQPARRARRKNARPSPRSRQRTRARTGSGARHREGRTERAQATRWRRARCKPGSTTSRAKDNLDVPPASNLAASPRLALALSTAALLASCATSTPRRSSKDQGCPRRQMNLVRPWRCRERKRATT